MCPVLPQELWTSNFNNNNNNNNNNYYYYYYNNFILVSNVFSTTVLIGDTVNK